MRDTQMKNFRLLNTIIEDTGDVDLRMLRSFRVLRPLKVVAKAPSKSSTIVNHSSLSFYPLSSPFLKQTCILRKNTNVYNSIEVRLKKYLCLSPILFLMLSQRSTLIWKLKRNFTQCHRCCKLVHPCCNK